MNDNKEVLVTTVDYIDKLVDGIEKCTNFYRTGDLGSANDYIMLIINGLEWVINVINLTQNTRTVAIDTASIKEHLLEIVEAMENSDTTLIADLLEYEIMECLQDWQSSLQEELN